jgi:zinc-binding alcohol dehydrogenase family protein
MQERTMKAVAYRRSLPITDAEALLDVTLPEPVVGGRDLLVRVEAVSVNPVDTKIRQRVDPQGADKVLGWDAAGTVVATGPEASLFKPGDRVYYAGALDRSGSNAELQLVDERIVGRRPKSLDVYQAAAMPLTAITAWELLFDRFGVPRGNAARSGTVLITGAAGGVGSMAVQLARRLTNLTVIGTASREQTRQWVLDMGAHHVVDHRGDLSAQVRAVAPQGVDYVLSLTHTEQHYAALVELLKPQGKLGLIDDPEVPLDINLLKRRSLSLHWEFMFTRSLYRTEDMKAQHQLLNEVADLVDAGVLRSTMTEHLGAIDAAGLRRAHARIESGSTIGKLVLGGFAA